MPPPEMASAAVVPRAWRIWLQAARPGTLFAGAVPVGLGTALAAAAGSWAPATALAALAGALGLQLGANFYNDYADFLRGADTASRLGPIRITQAGWASPRRVLAAAGAAFAGSALAGCYLISVAGWPVVAMGLSGIAGGIAYTGGPYPLAYHGLGELFVFLFFGLMAVAGTFYVHLGTVTAPVWAAGAGLGCLASAILVVNNLRDRQGDALCGKRTLAVRLGGRAARYQYIALVVAAYLCLGLGWGLSGRAWGWLLPTLTWPWARRLMAAVGRSEGVALNPLLGRTAQLEAAYGALLGLGVWLCR